MTNAPFNVGDKVVRIGDDVPGCNMYKGNIYTVKELWFCCPAAGWKMELEETKMITDFMMKTAMNVTCSIGHHKVAKPGWLCKLFALVDNTPSEHTSESLLEELSKPVREVQPV